MRQCVIVIGESIILQFRFHKRFGKILIVSMLRNQHFSILSFLKSYRKLYKPRRIKKWTSKQNKKSDNRQFRQLKNGYPTPLFILYN